MDHTHPDLKKNYVSRHEFFSFVLILGFVQNISKVAEVSLAKNILQQNKIWKEKLEFCGMCNISKNVSLFQN